MIEKIKNLKGKVQKATASVTLIGLNTMQAHAENSLFDDTQVDTGINTIQDNLLPIAIGLLVISIAWGIGMWASIMDSRRWYLPIIGIVVAFFLGDGFTEAVNSLKDQYTN